MAAVYKKILVCIDGSKYSNKALEHACNLAQSMHSKLFLTHVVENTIGLDFLDRAEYLKLLRNYGKSSLRKAEKITNSKNISTKVIQKEGKVVNSILDVVKKENCDLIVVGSHGFGAGLRLLLGSVSHKIVNRAQCPVLIIH